MSLTSNAQMIEDLMVEEPLVLEPQESGEHIVVYPEQPNTAIVLEMHEPESDFLQPLEVVEEHPGEIVLEVGDLPGVESLDPEIEKTLEVEEENEDENKVDPTPVTPQSIWDWSYKKPEEFLTWVQDRLNSVPSHSGYDTAGIERAIAYLEKLDSEISKAMRLDLDAKLDHNKVEETRAKIEDGIERLRERREKISKKNKKKKRSSTEQDSLVKEAQKIPGVSGIVVTVPLLISGIVRTCINGTVSAGHDIESIFNSLSKKYKLSDREKFESMQLLADMGYPVRRDRGFDSDEDVDPTSSDNFDWSGTFQN